MDEGTQLAATSCHAQLAGCPTLHLPIVGPILALLALWCLGRVHTQLPGCYSLRNNFTSPPCFSASDRGRLQQLAHPLPTAALPTASHHGLGWPNPNPHASRVNFATVIDPSTGQQVVYAPPKSHHQLGSATTMYQLLLKAAARWLTDNNSDLRAQPVLCPLQTSTPTHPQSPVRLMHRHFKLPEHHWQQQSGAYPPQGIV